MRSNRRKKIWKKSHIEDAKKKDEFQMEIGKPIRWKPNA